MISYLYNWLYGTCFFNSKAHFEVSSQTAGHRFVNCIEIGLTRKDESVKLHEPIW